MIKDVIRSRSCQSIHFVSMHSSTAFTNLTHLYKILLINILDFRHSSKCHAQLDLIAEQFQTKLDTFLALVGQSPKHWPANPHKVSTKCQRFEDICAVSDAAIYMDWNLATHGFDNLWQGIDSCQSTVQLTSTMVRYNDTVHAVMHC